MGYSFCFVMALFIIRTILKERSQRITPVDAHSEEFETGCLVGLGLFVIAMAILGAAAIYNWLVPINPALLIIPLAIVGFSGLYFFDSVRKAAEKVKNDKELREEQEAMAKILHEENDDWRDPHW